MLTLRSGVGGLPTLELSHASGSRAEVHLHGAHVTSWTPAQGGEALFLSRATRFGPGSAIRGGVPVIFPQFAELGPLPKHGFARTQRWEWVREHDQGSGVALLRLRDSDASRALWRHPFLAELRVELGTDTLAVRLTVTNPAPEPLVFTAALHTYLRVGDVRRAALEGLRGTLFRSRAEGEQVDGAEELTFAREVDRVYLDAPAPLWLQDPVAGRSLRIDQSGFADVVVWNPWEERAAALPDMMDDEYLEMLCVEAAQVATPVRLGAGESWSGEQRLEVHAAGR